ncbi:DUF2800 domain-containing protein [Shewanella sp. CG_4_10_14_0_8_um_filter_42_13]|uniref:DUF2800 domain-containing protein n=1 Tax=Shewanella sp. CG_4_10_14_0_8_um_filter_42_13 TaxID=1975534 RepID=UPI000CAB88FE|nr:DUF2800 domain-containing protein [Shewanella sp. CG_4_10_14_0_8_um_filter_42_13]PIY67145.1 MAG: hypothetical protein COY92_07155 [Shewanella sp. CG_4_10_14_0_8_um_filter_42_13]
MATHSVYSFSSSDRWIEGHCPASIRMSRGYPNRTNPQAELGTAVHQLGEFCIPYGIDTKECIGMRFNNHTVDDKMATDAGLYKSFVDNLTIRYGVKPLLEQRVVMSSLGRDDIYGTSDCTHIAGRILHTTDYKNGFGLVEVDDNSQTAGYSVATLDTFNLWDQVDEIYNTIVQPNGNHIDGPIRTVKYTRDDMLIWREKFRRSVILADDPDTKPNAGDWCEWCPAQTNCRARAEWIFHKAYTDAPLHMLSVPQVEFFYREIGGIKRFIDTIEKRMLDEARNGAKLDGFKLVQSYSRASVEDMDGFIKAVKGLGVDPTELYLDPRLVGKTRALKVLPKELVNLYYKTPKPSTTLVPLTDNRPAVRPGNAEGVFLPLRPSAVGIFTPISLEGNH